MKIDTSKYQKMAQKTNMSTEVKSFVHSLNDMVQQKGYPMQFRFKENPAKDDYTVITIYQKKDSPEPVMMLNSVLSSTDEVCNTLEKYALKNPNGLENLKDELDTPTKLNGVTEEMIKLVQDLNEPICMRVNGETVEIKPGDFKTSQEVIEERIKKIIDYLKRSTIHTVTSYPFKAYRDLKSEMMSAAKAVR